MPDQPIVDAHVHLWDPRRLNYRWLEDIEKLNRPYLLPDYDAASRALCIEKMVFVQCDCLPEQSLAEVQFVDELAEKDARIAGIVAHAPVERGKRVREDLEKLTKHPRVKGVRRLLEGEADAAFCLQPNFLAGLAELADFDLSFDVCIKSVQLAACIEMVKSTPQVRFVLDHLGKPDIKTRPGTLWKTELQTLAKLPNVACKISGILTAADRGNWQSEDLRPYVDHVLTCFGIERVMFGSDWPVVLLAGDLEKWADAVAEAVPTLTASEQRRLFRDNAIATYKLC